MSVTLQARGHPFEDSMNPTRHHRGPFNADRCTTMGVQQMGQIESGSVQVSPQLPESIKGNKNT